MKVNKHSMKLAMARKEMNISDLSLASEVSSNTLYYWLSKDSEPSTKLLGKVAAALEVDVTELIED